MACRGFFCGLDEGRKMITNATQSWLARNCAPTRMSLRRDANSCGPCWMDSTLLHSRSTFCSPQYFPRIVGRGRFSAAMAAAAAPTVNLSASPVLVDFSWRAWRLNSVGRRGAVVSSSADCMLSEEHGRGKTSTSFAKHSSINRGLDSAVLVAFLLHPASQVSQASPGSFFSLFQHQPCQ